MATVLSDRSQYRNRRPSQTMGLQQREWTLYTDPTLDEELSYLHLLIQVVDQIPPEDRWEMLANVGLRFGVLDLEAVRRRDEP